MTALDEVNQYLQRLEARVRTLILSRGAAVAATIALLLTVLLVWISNQYRFAESIVLPFRLLLFAALAVSIGVAIAVPLLRLNGGRITRLAELRVPEFDSRLLTITERPDPTNPFTEVVAEDALQTARLHGPHEFGPTAWLITSLSIAAASLSVLIWMIAAGPGYWGYGASLLWMGAAHAGSRPLYDISVIPGNKTVRRKSDQAITARLIGFSSEEVVLHAKYGHALKWEQIPMQPKEDAYQFVFAGLSDGIEYYVQAGESSSKHFKLNVKDLPGVRQVKVALHFPGGLGLRDVVDEHGGDIRAVEGTQADVSVLTDRPLEHGLLVLDDGKRLELIRGSDGWLTTRLPILKDGSYHIATVDEGETVRISDDYFIEAKKDEPPTVRITRPGRDPRVSPIEEVPVSIEAADDFGVESLELHYSVNGGQEHVTPLLKGKGTKEANAKTMLYLEDFKLQPGDLVTMYATARDVSKTAQSDMIFAQAEPFDFSFRQSQAMGGGGGEGQGGDEAQEIAERQKEIIAATWNQVKDGDKNRALIGQNARFLAEMQNKLSDQAKTLAERMGSRELVGASPQFEQFSKIMTEASSEMQRAVDQLRPARWHNALPPEQKALQDLLRADSMFRDIQVAFGHHGGGGGRGSMGAQQDLARMLDLELDMSKNQYETEQSPMAGSGNQQKQLDDALQKLKDLARRQQELAQQRAQQQTFHQRWEQEQLRREAEQLRQQMQQLSRNQEASESQSERSQMGQQSASGQQQSQSGQESQSGEATQLGQRGVSEAGRQAMQAIETAEEEMRRAVSDHDATAQRRAEEQLSEAQKSLQRALEQQAGNSLADLARRAQQLSQHQSDLANRVKRQYGAEGVNTAENDAQAGTGMPEMKGPGYAGGGYWRHRLIPEPIRPSTPQERALAVEGDKLADQVKQLQREVEQQARDLAAEQPNAVSKLRKALSDAEQQELALRMQKNSEWLRNGYGDQTWAMEDSITAGMQQLSRQLQQAQRALGQGNSPAQNDALARALDEARGLRAQIAAGSPTIGGGTREAMDDFAMLGRNDRSLREYTNGAIEYLQHVQGQDGLLDARISANAARSLERLEAELERRLGEQGSSSARTGAREDAPEAYRDAVAEYFRRLSK